ncbi:MAG: hypothetical protein ACI9HI_000389 [Salinirussus sp.]|jgi:hypothetical protein
MRGHDGANGPRPHTSRRRLLAATGALSLGVLAGCVGGDSGPDTSGTVDGGTSGGTDRSWRTTELTDVLTDETFSIDGLAGPVAVQSFAVWCPKCQRQSEALSNTDGSVTVVGLNTDPNEDAAKVRQHAESNGFDWRFAVAPAEMTESLVAEFGPTVTNAPSTPVIVACDEGVAEFFSGSQQSAEAVQSAAADC